MSDPTPTLPVLLSKTLPANLPIQATPVSASLVGNTAFTNTGANPIFVAGSQMGLQSALMRTTIAAGATVNLPFSNVNQIWMVSAVGSSVQIAGSQYASRARINGLSGAHKRYDVTLTAAGSANTYHAITKAPFKFTHARPIFAQQETTPGIVTDVATAATTSNADTVTPTTGNTLTNDGVRGWQRGYFDGSNGMTGPAAGADLQHPNLFAPDFIPVRSVPTTDGTPGFYCMFRVKYSNSFTYIQVDTNKGVVDPSRIGYLEVLRSNATNAIVDPTLLTNANKVVTNATPFWGFEFYDAEAVGGPTVLVIGDSITEGVGASLTYDGWESRLERYFVSQNIPISLINCGMRGNTTTSYLAQAKKSILLHQPSHAMYSIFSPNDGPSGAFVGGLTQAVIDVMFNNALDFVMFCKANNVAPAFSLLAPNNFYTIGDYTLIEQLKTRCLALGVPVMDLRSAVSDGANPARFKAGYTTDGVHPLDIGHEAMKDLAVTEFRAAITF